PRSIHPTSPPRFFVSSSSDCVATSSRKDSTDLVFLRAFAATFSASAWRLRQPTALPGQATLVLHCGADVAQGRPSEGRTAAVPPQPCVSPQADDVEAP